MVQLNSSQIKSWYRTKALQHTMRVKSHHYVLKGYTALERMYNFYWTPNFIMRRKHRDGTTPVRSSCASSPAMEKAPQSRLE
ncbi:hypothetical protein CEXT_286171 [Caerostris extrusa]|uniref:Uncharacterized protein n=1 Tax=Caerostris extrusa TaxID=172846 RepID=A0AAV4VJN6_CAEEX|nr:hypothetical protein CEXT_286171 [Caerostris extrusa]